jgi:fibronectin-binding autotransporter adhesin
MLHLGCTGNDTGVAETLFSSCADPPSVEEKMMRAPCRSLVLAIAALALAQTSPHTPQASAAILQWRSSATAGVNWSDASLWNPVQAPTTGDDIAFTATPVAGGSRATNNDITGLSISTVNTTQNQYTVSGNALTLTGGSWAFSGIASSTHDVNAAVAISQDTTVNVVMTAASGTSARLNWGGALSGSFGITKTGSGTLRYQGTAKTYSGNTVVTAGTLDMSADNMMPFGAGKGDLSVGSGATFFLNNINTQVNGLNDYNGVGGTVSKGGSGSRSLTLGNGDANGSFSGSITFTGGSTTSVNKVGSGTQTLGGAVSVVGSGNVTGGRLNVNGTWNTGMAVNSTGTLGGTGSIAGTVNIGNAATAGTISPGMSVGTLSVANLVFSSNGVYAAELNGTVTTPGGVNNDLITGVTNLTLDGTLNVSETVAGSFASAVGGSTWRLINYTGTLTNNTLVLGTIPTLPAGGTLSIDTATAGQVNLLLTIPEPTSLLAIGATGLIALRRRR